MSISLEYILKIILLEQGITLCVVTYLSLVVTRVEIAPYLLNFILKVMIWNCYDVYKNCYFLRHDTYVKNRLYLKIQLKIYNNYFRNIKYLRT